MVISAFKRSNIEVERELGSGCRWLGLIEWYWLVSCSSFFRSICKCDPTNSFFSPGIEGERSSYHFTGDQNAIGLASSGVDGGKPTFAEQTWDFIVLNRQILISEEISSASFHYAHRLFHLTTLSFGERKVKGEQEKKRGECNRAVSLKSFSLFNDQNWITSMSMMDTDKNISFSFLVFSDSEWW